MARRRRSKADKLTQCRQRIDHSRKWRKDEGYDDAWRRYVDLYRGKHFDQVTTEDRIAINIVFSTLNVIFPSISITEPKITLSANKPEFENTALITEAVVNYWWKHHDWHKPFRRATKDFLAIGHGWIKTTYKFVEEPQALDEAELQGELEARTAELDSYAAMNPEMAASMPSDEEVAANITTTKMVVVHDAPIVERVSPFDMFIDPEATCLEDAAWIAQRIIRPLGDVRNDERYNSGPRKAAKADMGIGGAALDPERVKKLDADQERVTVWEYYDLRNRTVSVFSELGEGFLIDPEPMPYAFGQPFTMMVNYEVPDEIYPIGEIEMIEAPQQELNKTRSALVNHREKYGRKYLYRETAFDEDAKLLLASKEDNLLVPVIGDEDLDSVIAPVPQSPMQADMYNLSEIIESDIDKISGINEYARGATPEIRRTATEAAIIQDAANARAADKLGVVEKSIGDVARHVVMLAQQYLTGEQVARITGSDGVDYWFEFLFEDIQGEFDFSVVAGSTQPQNETFRRQQAVAMMNAVGPLIGTVLDPAAIAMHVLREGFGVKSPEKFLLPMGPPMMGPEGDPGMGGPPRGEPGMNGEQPSPLEDPRGGSDAVPPGQLNQLAGQVGYSTNTM